jgi:hypothetical protein
MANEREVGAQDGDGDSGCDGRGRAGVDAVGCRDLGWEKVLLIDSYHEGYEWSDGIVNGAKKAFKDSGIDLKVFRMDTKRNGSDDFK